MSGLSNMYHAALNTVSFQMLEEGQSVLLTLNLSMQVLAATAHCVL